MGDMMKKWIKENMFMLLLMLSGLPIIIQAVWYLSYESLLLPVWILLIGYALVLFLAPISMIEKWVMDV